MDIVVIVLAVGAALGYSAWKAWGLFKPGPKAGCGCSDSKGCAGCPVAEFKGSLPRNK